MVYIPQDNTWRTSLKMIHGVHPSRWYMVHIPQDNAFFGNDDFAIKKFECSIFQHAQSIRRHIRDSPRTNGTRWLPFRGHTISSVPVKPYLFVPNWELISFSFNKSLIAIRVVQGERPTRSLTEASKVQSVFSERDPLPWQCSAETIPLLYCQAYPIYRHPRSAKIHPLLPNVLQWLIV